jgi:cytoskeletal protein RodZ
MVHNQPIASAVSTELSASLQQTLTGRRLRNLEQIVSLPGSFSSFLLLILAVALVSGGMALLIVQSVQIFQLRQQINKVEIAYQAVERQNAELVWAIAQHTSLNRVRQRALALGYEPPSERHYVVQATPANTARTAQISPANPSLSATESPDVRRSSSTIADHLQQIVNQARQSWWP